MQGGSAAWREPMRLQVFLGAHLDTSCQQHLGEHTMTVHEPSGKGPVVDTITSAGRGASFEHGSRCTEHIEQMQSLLCTSNKNVGSIVAMLGLDTVADAFMTRTRGRQTP